MTKKITTEATKAKLPRPKRKRPMPPEQFGELMESMNQALAHAKAERKRPEPKPQHDLDAQRQGLWDAATIAELRTRVPNRTLFIPSLFIPATPPNVEPWPWPVRVLNGVDDWVVRVRRAVARGVRRLAYWVEP